MPEAHDTQSLREFAEGQSDAAFAALVSQHVNLVYSVALRQVGNPHAAKSAEWECSRSQIVSFLLFSRRRR